MLLEGDDIIELVIAALVIAALVVAGVEVLLAAVPPDDPHPARNNAPAAAAPTSPIVLRFTDTPPQTRVRA